MKETKNTDHRPRQASHEFDKQGHCRDCGDRVESQHRDAHECHLRIRDFGTVAAVDFSDQTTTE